jgi:hypothetical protein
MNFFGSFDREFFKVDTEIVSKVFNGPDIVSVYPKYARLSGLKIDFYDLITDEVSKCCSLPRSGFSENNQSSSIKSFCGSDQLTCRK